MSSSESPAYRLTVEAPEPGLGVMVIDAEGNVVGRCAEDDSRIELDLPRGLYTVRAHRSGAFAETVVRLDRAQTVKVQPPPLFSAATIPGAATTHEYYTYPAWEASQQPTVPEQAWNGLADARLLLFARALQSDLYRGENQLASLSLRTLDGRTLSTFAAGEVKQDARGWSAYSAHLSHGLLILEDHSERPRQIPVPLFSGWQTQLFVMHNKRLLWEDMRVITVSVYEIDSRGNRDPYDRNASDVRAAMDMDVGLLALQNDTPSVAPQLVAALLNAKFQNPILGLLGAYLMLLHYRRKTSSNADKLDSNHIRMVLNNLHNLMPELSDVAALRLMAKPWVDVPDPGPTEGVPLFRCGAEALLEAAASDPALLPEGSLLDAISGNLYGDTVWTTWKPLTLPFGRHDATALTSNVTAEPNWVEQALVDAVSVAERRGQGFTADELVRRIGVSPHTVRDAIDQLMARAARSQALPEAEGQNLHLLGGEVVSNLARKVGAQFDHNLWKQVVVCSEAQGRALAKPSIQQVYARLKGTLAECAGPDTGKISADTFMAEIIKPGGKLGWHDVGRRLSQRFHDHGLTLSGVEVAAVETVRDLAQLMARKLNL